MSSRCVFLVGGLGLAAAVFAAGEESPAGHIDFIPPPAGSYVLQHIRTLLIEEGLTVN